MCPYESLIYKPRDVTTLGALGAGWSRRAALPPLLAGLASPGGGGAAGGRASRDYGYSCGVRPARGDRAPKSGVGWVPGVEQAATLTGMALRCCVRLSVLLASAPVSKIIVLSGRYRKASRSMEIGRFGDGPALGSRLASTNNVPAGSSSAWTSLRHRDRPRTSTCRSVSITQPAGLAEGPWRAAAHSMRCEDATWYYHLRHRHVCNRQLLRNAVRQRCNKSAQFRHRVRGSSGSRPSPATFCEQPPHLPLEASPQLIRQLRHLPCLRARGLGACHNRHPVRSHLLGALDLASSPVTTFLCTRSSEAAEWELLSPSASVRSRCELGRCVAPPAFPFCAKAAGSQWLMQLMLNNYQIRTPMMVR